MAIILFIKYSTLLTIYCLITVSTNLKRPAGSVVIFIDRTSNVKGERDFNFAGL